MRAAAQTYAARGGSVIPIAPRAERPLLAWTELQQRHATRDEIDARFRRWSRANAGIVTGYVSGRVVIDLDARHGGRPRAVFQPRERGAPGLRCAGTEHDRAVH